jgi:hypothetical protein
LSAPVDWEPLTDLLPDQPPEALQEVALVADQESELEAPFATLLGLADKVTLGAACETERMTVCEALVPLEPVQVRV